MPSEGPNAPGTMADDASVGTEAWRNVDNAKACGGGYAVADCGWFDWGCGVKDYSVKIVKSDGGLGSQDKSNPSLWPSGGGFVSHGGAADLWGESWEPADINNSNFGVVVSGINTCFGTTTHYLKATNFGFSIPAGATIDGILVEIYKMSYTDWTFVYAYIDCIRITVYFTEAAVQKSRAYIVE
jgi:hypothetical protein